ncbi:MAG: APC family permease, partial [Planctomycetes bacterium]|nr:APC family permease [Planctomycetota bacterium]
MSPADRRRLGSISLGAIVAANMIGAGVFTTSGYALADLGARGPVMLAWVLGGVIALLGAASYSALAARLSESGGEYLFLSRTLHPRLGFVAGWVSIWAGFTGAVALAAEAAQAYLEPWIPDGVPLDLVGSAAIVAAGIVHASGVHRGARLQNVVVGLKLAVLVVFVLIGATQLEPQPTPPARDFDFATFASTMMWVSLSYSGWNAAVYVAGEARDPESTLPRSMLGATGVVTVLYLALNWIFVSAAPVAQLAGEADVAAVAARAIGGAPLESLVRVVLVIALLTSVSSMVMIGPRVLARMADDGRLPAFLAFRGDVPRAAIWTQVALSVAILWASGLREQLTNLGWILSLFTALSVLGLVRLRAREGAERVPVLGYPLVPLVFVIAVLGLAAVMLVTSAAELWPALILFALGLLTEKYGTAFVFP